MARVGRRRRDHPRGRRGPRRPRAPRARAAPPRRPAAEDRQLLRRVERHRDRDRRRRGRDRAAPPRRAVVLGLRRRGPVPADRHERGAGRPDGRSPTRTRCSSRRTSSSAAPARRACWWPSAALLRNRVPVGARRRDDPVRQPDRALLPPRPGDPRGGRHARRSSSRSARASPSRSRTRSAATRSAAASTTSRAGRWHSWAANPRIEILGNPELERLAIVSLGLRHAARPAARQLRRRRPQRPLRHPGAQRLLLRGALPAPHVPDRRRVVAAHGRGGRQGAHGREARVHPPQLQLLHQRDRLRATSSTPST